MRLYLSTGPHLHAHYNTRRIMINVLLSLLPCCVAGVYLFGWRVLAVLLTCCATAVLCEALWQSLRHKPNTVDDFSALVTGLLFGLTLPSTVPIWLAVVGSAIAILLIKQLFGGIGHNFLNPALAARIILLISWPTQLAVHALPQRLFFPASSAAVYGVDAATTATPLISQDCALFDLLVGNVSGSIGGVCKVAILIGLLYLLIRQIVDWRIPVLYVGTVALLSWILGEDPLRAVLTGGMLFGAVFMATDYVTSPMLRMSRCIYAVGCGVITTVIRLYGSYAEGSAFSILLMNCATPLLDKYCRRRIYGEVKQHA